MFFYEIVAAFQYKLYRDVGINSIERMHSSDMAFLSMRDVSISFGSAPLLDKVNLQIEKGENVCLLGRNGEGKTTFLRLINKEVEPDDGIIILPKGVSMATLSQELPPGLKGSVHDVVAGGLGRIGGLLEEFHGLSIQLADGSCEDLLQRIDQVQHQLEMENGWQIHQQVETILTRLGLNPDICFETLSVGMRRRVLLARALVADPDILLLDEPTNHLDIKAISWMEEFLRNYRGTLLFVTHDRMFLQNLATRIIEIDRGNISNWACDYKTFLGRRQAALDTEEGQRAQFNKKLAKEEEWIRKGIKARRTRNEGRVRELLKMRKKQQAWRRQTGNARIKIQEAERTGKIVIEAKGITHGYGKAPFIKDFSIKIIRGDRIGIIGANGSGKSSLLKILLRDITPDKGNVRTGTRLEISYFDQLRDQLDEDKTVQDNIGDGNDMLTINGNQRHVIGYLKDFLFSPDRARSPVRTLSGGERNRLLLARLFTRPSNLLVLDEPTNDLDIETLELLEERLLEYSGTILLVSHDREFLNNVVTSTIVFEEGQKVIEYAGGYDDWLIQRPVVRENGPAEKGQKIKRSVTLRKRNKSSRPRKLTFKERKELELLPVRIEALEKEQGSLYGRMADPGFYRESGDGVGKARARMEELEQELAEAYDRWEELELIREANPQ